MRGSSKVRTVISGTVHSACISRSSCCRIQEAEGQSRRVGSEQATRKVTKTDGGKARSYRPAPSTRGASRQRRGRKRWEDSWERSPRRKWGQQGHATQT